MGICTAGAFWVSASAGAMLAVMPHSAVLAQTVNSAAKSGYRLAADDDDAYLSALTGSRYAPDRALAPQLVQAQPARPAPAPAQAPAAAKPATPDDLAPVSKVRKRPPSPNANVNLIYALIDKGTLTEEEGQTLIKQAEDEAYIAREAVKSAKEKSESAEEASNKAVESVPAKGSRRVAYVPEIVKEQLRDDVRKEVMARAEAEGWAAPNALPEWTKRVRVFGDVRTRYDGAFFPRGNGTPSFEQIDYYAANRESTPDNLADTMLPPLFNFDEDRNRFRLRARVGIEANVLDNFFVGTRLATGSDNSPVSTNQTLGANGSNFSKYDVWIDRAFISYAPSSDFKILAGRFDNPFFATDLVWDSDVGFDGAAIQLKHDLYGEDVTGFATFGAFPLYSTAFNFPSREPSKDLNEDRYLFGAQGGLKGNLGDTGKLVLGVGYYNFDNVAGDLSSPCINDFAAAICDSDNDRPLFGQKGNTFRLLRDGTGTTANPANFQYYGLASGYEELTVTGSINLGFFAPFHIIIDGEFVKNLAFDRDFLQSVAINNRGPDLTDPAGGIIEVGRYDGGDTGYLARLTVGDLELKARGDWNFSLAYKYLESDAVFDALTDSDFGLGGTNLKGFIVGGKVALGRNVFTEAKYLSADAIAGAPYGVDVVLVDLNAKF